MVINKNFYAQSKLLFICLVAVFSFLVSLATRAQAAPDKMLDSVTQELLASLKVNDRELKVNPDKIYGIVKGVLVPHVNAEYMARSVLGKNVWLEATPSQQSRFIEEFRMMLVRTYASSFLAYSNQTVEYYPVQGGVEGKTRVQVSSVIRQPAGQPIRVAYRLVIDGSQWKVYDIIVEGVSLLQGLQAQFAEDVRGQGIDALIEKMHNHNQKPLKRNA
jgi:phospholipid transport system substrate-binding protein